MLKNLHVIARSERATKQSSPIFSTLFRALHQIFTIHRKPLTIFFFAALAIFILPENAFAGFDETRKTWIESAQTGMTVVMLVISKLLWLALVIIGPLLDNSILFSSCVEGTGEGANFVCNTTMEDSLLSVWVQIRNIVNIIFVVILVFTALYNVIGRTEGEFVLKTMLPKIIIGLIAVNFSFLIGKVVLDAANVATTAVAALPVQSIKEVNGQNLDALKKDMASNMCSHYQENPDKTYTSVHLNQSQIDQWGLNGICELDGTFNKEFESGFLSGFTHTNLAFIMTAEIAKLSKFKFVSERLFQFTPDQKATASQVFDQILDLLLDIIVNFIIMALYGVAVLALLAVAVVRIVVLWLMLALSPLVILFIIIPQLGQGLGELDLKSAFVQHAIAPVIMMGSLSIGFILLASMTKLSADATTDFTLPNGALGTAVNGVIKGNFHDMHLGDLLALIGGVMVIWTGVFAAANKTYANFITEKLSSFTKQGAGFLAKLPLYATPIPVTPAKGGEGKSISLGHGAQILENMWQGMGDKLSGRDALTKAANEAGLGHLLGDEKANAIRDFKGKATDLNSVKTNLGTLTVAVELNEGDWGDVFKHIREVANKPENAQQKNDLLTIATSIENNRGDFEKIKSELRAHGITIDKPTAKPGQTTPQPLSSSTTASQLVEAAQKGDLTTTAIKDIPQPMKNLATAIEGLGIAKDDVLKKVSEHLKGIGKENPDAFIAAAIEIAKSGKTDQGTAKTYLEGITDLTKKTQAEKALQTVITAAGGTVLPPPQ